MPRDKQLRQPVELYREDRDRPLRCWCGSTYFYLVRCRCSPECKSKVALCEYCRERHEMGLMPERRPEPAPETA